jgi:ABC-2 type transport system ATP-binding protein
MIEVEHLTKRFGRTRAVNDVSFSVKRGEIVGFLGPNGAGKTTTMRILSGYLPASGGTVRVADRDVVHESLEVRRRIGYMPENVPLYPEMRVDEYLRFRGALKGVDRGRLRTRVNAVKEQCGLEEAGRRIIGQLSKGYRQRVGLADALIHEPELLILDEPTIGLDPNQIRQVRELIRALAEKHTILLSTHILPEVEMTCERVLIISQGRIVASDTPDNLQQVMQGSMRVVAELRATPDEAYEQLNTLPHVQRVNVHPVGQWTRFELECSRNVDLRQNVYELAVRRNWTLRELTFEQSTLEDVFVSLTHASNGVDQPLEEEGEV